MLNLTIIKARSIYNSVLLQESEANSTRLESSPSQNSFLVDFQAFSPNLYVFRAKDLDHKLTFEMTLELKECYALSDKVNEEEEYLSLNMACTFPRMNVQHLNEKQSEDQFLQGILMFQFQLKILEQLFLFCEDKNALNLFLTFNNVDLDYIEIYRRFFVSEKQVITARGEQIEIHIPTNVETYNELVDFMDEVDHDFRRILWREQKTNLVFREYLKCYSLSSV